MKIEKLLIIPERENIEEYLTLCHRYGCGFEYNDFFQPDMLTDADGMAAVIHTYQSYRLPEYCTLHGAFLDVTIFSDDPAIRRISQMRVEQSLSAAQEMGAKAVVFHTNYVANFLSDRYRKSWVERNASYWKQKLSEYPDLRIYIENMFDIDPVLLAALAECMQDEARFGVCLDYAHAHVFGNPDRIDEWVRMLAPYVKHIHINDNDWKSDSHLAVGDGRIDWKHFAENYDAYFPDASVLIEVNGMDKIHRSLQFMKEV